MPPRDANPVLYDELISCCHKAEFTPDVIAEMAGDFGKKTIKLLNGHDENGHLSSRYLATQD